MTDSQPPQPSLWQISLDDLIASHARAVEVGGPVGSVAEQHFAEKVRNTLEAATDQELITEWSKTTWESEPAYMEAMVAEMDHRRLDFGA